MQFEANVGQTEASVRYLSRGPGYTLFLTPGEAVLSLRAVEKRALESGNPDARGGTTRQKDERSPKARVATKELRLILLGANKQPQIEGVQEVPGTVNYFLGDNPNKWRTAIHAFAKVRYSEVYPGVDLIYYGNQRQLEYDFIVKAGASPDRLAFDVGGADYLEVDDQGRLVAHLDGGTVCWRKPFAYQETETGQRAIPVRFVVSRGTQFGFQVGDYDPTRPLVIDPVLVYATYLGGSGDEYVGGIAVDSSGNVFVIGDTPSLNFPTVSAYRSTAICSNDVFVTKVRAGGSNLVYSTYLGGTSDDFGGGIAIDSAGNAYLTGTTESTGFPTTGNAIRLSNSGYYDAFISKLGPFGTNLLYSTYLGGSSDDFGSAIAVDNSGTVVVAGQTYSTTTGNPKFPATQSAYQKQNSGGLDAWVAKIDTVSGTLSYCTYLGGNTDEKASSIAMDGAGNAYVAGQVLDNTTIPPAFPASNFPLQSAFQSTFNPGATDPYTAGRSDGFVTKINSAGTGLIFSTFLGGNDDDMATGITLDAAARVYVIGETSSTNFPTTSGALQPSIADPDNSGYPAPDFFVTKFQTNATSLLYSTYLGGEDFEVAFRPGGLGFAPRLGIAVDSVGNIYAAGQTTSIDFPVTVGADQTNAYGPSDAFVVKINPAVPGPAGLIYSTLLGGDNGDRGVAVGVDTNGNYYAAGMTTSTTLFPVTLGAFRGTNSGGNDVFVAKLSSPPDLSVAMSLSSDPVMVKSNLTYTIQVNNNGRSTFNNVTNTFQIPPGGGIISVSGPGIFRTNGSQLTCYFGILTNNQSVIETITLTNSSPGVITNLTTVTSTETLAGQEPNTGNNTASVVSSVRGINDVRITVVAVPNPVLVTSNLIYTIGITNKSGDPATSCVVTDALPASLTLVWAVASQGTWDTNAGVLTWSGIGTLAAGAGAAITITNIASAPGLATNVANVTAFELDSNLGNNSDTTITTNLALADLALGQTASANPISSGSNLTYTIAITNQGPTMAASVVLTDTLPAGAAFVSATTTQGTTNFSGGTFTCNLGGMNSNGTATVTLTARLNQAGSATNTASVSSAATDPNSANNAASVVTTVIDNSAAPLLKITPAGTNVVLSWSTNAVGMNLQSRAGLSTNSAWAAVTNVPVRVGDQFMVTNSAAGSSRFYRLSSLNLASVPTLRIMRTVNTVQLSWPNSYPGFGLISTTNLVEGSEWTVVTNDAIDVGGYFMVTDPDADELRKFYRLVN